MTKYLGFSNSGELDIMGLIVMGASTKRGDITKIGEFGTGWKYAIATLLRNGINIDIYVGEKRLHISTRKVDVSGSMFDMVTIDGIDTNFTTDLGPQWTVWMAIREIYCNSLDEPHSTTFISNEPQYQSYIKAYKTLVFIKMTEAVADVVDRWMEYFSFERYGDLVDEKEGHLKVFKPLHSDRSIIYRKGIKVAETKKKGCFDYDFYNIDINELRAADLSNVEYYLKENLLKHFSGEVVNKVLSTPDTWEKDISFYTWDTIKNKASWKKAIGNKMVMPQEFSSRMNVVQNNGELAGPVKDAEAREETLLQVPTVLAQIIADDKDMEGVNVVGFMGGNKSLAVPHIISGTLEEKISAAIEFIRDAKLLPSDEKLPLIAICKFADYTQSVYVNNTISITHDAEDMSITDISILIAKEMLLHESDLKRCSTSFENWLISRLLDARFKLSYEQLISD